MVLTRSQTYVGDDMAQVFREVLAMSVLLFIHLQLLLYARDFLWINLQPPSRHVLALASASCDNPTHRATHSVTSRVATFCCYDLFY